MEPWAETDIKEGLRTIGMLIRLDGGFVLKNGEIWMSDEEAPAISIKVPRQIGGGYLEVRAQYYNKSDTDKMGMAHKGQLLARWQGVTNRKKWTGSVDIERDEIIADSRGCTAFKLWVHTINTWTKVELHPDPDSWHMPMKMVKEGDDPGESDDWEEVDYIQLPDSDPEPETPTPEPQVEHTKGEQYMMNKKTSKVEKFQLMGLGL